ncbi:MAG: very short patch repair endonuclease [Xanthomonadales bacterium]|nr:very short patch repair endonuclease [Xanthomonadales bacterium]
MVDIVDKKTRSRMMSGIRGKNTKPERLIRSALHRAGFRFALHARKLPGKPDVVLPRWNVVVFVHGCFWHRHERCHYASTPASRPDFWQKKFASNVDRDARNIRELEDIGWRVAVVWECGLRHQLDETTVSLAEFIRGEDRQFIELPADPPKPREH